MSVGRENYLKAMRQLRAKQGPIYEKWLRNWKAGVEYQQATRMRRQNARSKGVTEEGSGGAEEDA